MTFAELLEWQWSDYTDKHRNRTNLLIHIVAVPLFWLGAFQGLGALLLLLLGVPGVFGMLVWAAVLTGGSLFAQARGHALEATPPAPFTSSKDFLRRIVAEQFLTFPRFVLSGHWYGNLRAAS